MNTHPVELKKKTFPSITHKQEIKWNHILIIRENLLFYVQAVTIVLKSNPKIVEAEEEKLTLPTHILMIAHLHTQLNSYLNSCRHIMRNRLFMFYTPSTFKF